MEEVIFPQPAVATLLHKFVRVRLYTDDAHAPERSAGYRKLQIERFKTPALPLFAILTPDNQIVATFEGSTKNVAEFVTFLRSGLENPAEK